MYSFASALQNICSKCGIRSNSQTCSAWLCRICNEHQEVSHNGAGGGRKESRSMTRTNNGSAPVTFAQDARAIFRRLESCRIAFLRPLKGKITFHWLPLSIWNEQQVMIYSTAPFFKHCFCLIQGMNNAVAQFCFDVAVCALPRSVPTGTRAL